MGKPPRGGTGEAPGEVPGKRTKAGCRGWTVMSQQLHAHPMYVGRIGGAVTAADRFARRPGDGCGPARGRDVAHSRAAACRAPTGYASDGPFARHQPTPTTEREERTA